MLIQTELSVREAKKKVTETVQLITLIEKYGEPILIESKEKEASYLSDSDITLSDGQQLWVFPKEGISYWNILVITDESGQIITGDVDRLWGPF